MIPAGKLNCLNTGIIRPKCICGISPSPLNLVKSCPCEFWFDGQDAATLSLNGNKVIQWDDKSGFDRHVSQAVDAQRPTWDPVTGRVTFNNVAQTYLQSVAFDVPLAQPNTIFILYKITDVITDLEYIFDGIIISNQLYFINTFRIRAGVVLSNGVANLNNNIHIAEFNGVISNYWINGILTVGPGNAGPNPLDGITLGATAVLVNNADAEIMEVFGYNCLLTEAERIKCENYLINKWGLPY